MRPILIFCGMVLLLMAFRVYAHNGSAPTYVSNTVATKAGVSIEAELMKAF